MCSQNAINIMINYYDQPGGCAFPCSGDFNLMCGGYFMVGIYFNNSDSVRHDSWETILSTSIQNSDTSPYRRSGTASVGGIDSFIIYGGYTWYLLEETFNSTFNATSDQILFNETAAETLYNKDYNSTTALTIFNDIWKFDLTDKQWILLHNGSGEGAPTPRMFASAVLDLDYGYNSGRVIVFGGYTRTQALGDVWAFDLRTRQWNVLNKGRIDGYEGYDQDSYAPPERGGHSAILYNSLMYVFAGASEYNIFNDVWVYSLTSNTWSEVHIKSPKPDPRTDHSMILVEDSLIVTFGRGKGSDGQCYASKVYRDVWQFDIQQKTWTLLSEGSAPWDLVNHYWSGSLPSKRYGHSMMPIKNDNSFVVFGGVEDYNPLNDIWRFDLSTHSWNQLTGATVVPFNRTGVACVPVGDTMVTEYKIYR
jgi:N-acetylneuraminic acid mutarotase